MGTWGHGDLGAWGHLGLIGGGKFSSSHFIFYWPNGRSIAGRNYVMN